MHARFISTNFVRCENKLKRAFKEIDNERSQYFIERLRETLARWIRNQQAAIHMGEVWDRQTTSTRSILSSLFSTHRKSLDEESLLTLVAETEGILNASPLTMETISDFTSDFHLAPSNFPAMKSKVVMSPSGN